MEKGSNHDRSRSTLRSRVDSYGLQLRHIIRIVDDNEHKLAVGKNGKIIFIDFVFREGYVNDKKRDK